MGQVGWGELVVILAILLLVFGAKRLPEIGRSVGRTFREFQRSMRGKSDDDNDKKGTQG